MPASHTRLLWVFIFLLGWLPTGWAQMIGGQTYGAFGPRPLGQTLAPRPRTFGGRLDFTPDGGLMGISNRNSAFATPWRQPLPPPLYPHQPLIPSLAEPSLPYGVPQVGTPAPFVPQPIQPEALPMPEPLPMPEVTPNGLPAAEPGPPPTNPQGVSLTPARATEYTAYRPIAGKTPTGAPALRSAALSERFTRLANNAGIQTPVGINVYLQGATAILKGTVATDHDRELLGNVVALEPGIGQIDNRLTVDPSVGK